jgi:hypothetical protein
MARKRWASWKIWGLAGLIALLAAPAADAPAASRGTAIPGIEAVDTASLKSIAAWLKESGKEGFVAGDVADAAGIPRGQAEDALEAKQRGFKSGNVLRIAQIPTDEARNFLLFMVQKPDGEVYFYHSTVKEGLKKAFVSIPGQNAVLPLGSEEAQVSFQREISYWEARIAGI